MNTAYLNASIPVELSLVKMQVHFNRVIFEHLLTLSLIYPGLIQVLGAMRVLSAGVPLWLTVLDRSNGTDRRFKPGQRRSLMFFSMLCENGFD